MERGGETDRGEPGPRQAFSFVRIPSVAVTSLDGASWLSSVGFY